ncbi:methyltransferase [Burkholderia sp. MSMB1078WGS]|uniref:SAM-dependent methyltransferase n=1 Tax=Burkholderia sp. MSMB1078WGS TaxID=1637900 RepID=UPI00075AD912|nr:class I SAM-dependent methyltransferase [Burkholderia sp. MSMB1078WGS]KVT12746.1 methyltransferase [Burkholderia sp. MSMB1078WGS]
MNALHASAAEIEIVQGTGVDPYQDMVEKVYADPSEEWRKIIGSELWYQYGIFDEKTDPHSDPLDASGRRHMELQFELAEQAGADLSVSSVRRALDIGCGWGPVLRFLAARYPDCHVDGINISPSQMECARQMVEREGLADRVRLYLCNAKDIAALPRPDIPYDLAILRGSLIHFPPEVLQAALAALAARMRLDATVIISESLYKVDLATYQSFIPDKVDRAASGHRKTPDGLQKALEDHGFAVIDQRILPSNAEVVRWYDLVRENIEAHCPPPRKANFEELRDISISFGDALRKDKASSFSFVARRASS